MRAKLIENADATFRVAEDNEIFAKQANFQRIAIGLGHFFNQAGRQPMAAHDLAHRRIALDTAQEIIFLFREHGGSSRCLGL